MLIQNTESKNNQEEEPNLDDLPRLLKDLEELQSQFDRAAVEKHKLNTELENCIQRLEAATLIVEKYKKIIIYCIEIKSPDRSKLYKIFIK